MNLGPNDPWSSSPLGDQLHLDAEVDEGVRAVMASVWYLAMFIVYSGVCVAFGWFIHGGL